MGSANSRNGSDKGGKGFKFNPAQWINVPLSEEDKTWLEDNVTNVEVFANWLSDVVASGLHVSGKYDDRNNCCVFSIVEKGASKDRILTGRGSTAFTAAYAALYRHFILLEQDWSQFEDVQGSVGLFD